MAKGSTVAFGGQHYHATLNFDAGNLFLERNPVNVMSLVRREALEAVGGFDAGLVHGMEDWDLWLKLASHGYWGAGIPEFLDWYRRRPDHADRWQSWTQSGHRGHARAVEAALIRACFVRASRNPHQRRACLTHPCPPNSPSPTVWPKTDRVCCSSCPGWRWAARTALT